MLESYTPDPELGTLGLLKDFLKPGIQWIPIFGMYAGFSKPFKENRPFESFLPNMVYHNVINVIVLTGIMAGLYEVVEFAKESGIVSELGELVEKLF